jgi:acyl dehydratase
MLAPSPRYSGLFDNLWPLAATYAKGIVRALRPRPAGAGRPAAPERLVRTLGDQRIDVAKVREYLALTDGTDLGYVAREEVPPLFFTTFMLRPFLSVIADDELGLNLLGLVHLENEVLVHAPIHHADTVTCRVRLERLDREPHRILLGVHLENLVADRVASEAHGLMLLRLGRAGASRSRPASGDLDDRTWTEVRTFDLAADLGRRYGLLTGDVNPIHLSRLTSRIFGFSRPIAHGYCLQALVAHALTRVAPAGGRLTRLAIRFRAPATLPGRVRCEVQGDAFRLVSSDGARTLADGEISLAQAS